LIEQLQEIANKDFNLVLHTLEFADYNSISDVLNFVNTNYSSYFKESKQGYLVDKFLHGKFDRNIFHCLFKNENLVFREKFYVYFFLISIFFNLKVNNLELTYLNEQDFYGNIPLNYLLESYEVVMNNIGKITNKNKKLVPGSILCITQLQSKAIIINLIEQDNKSFKQLLSICMKKTYLSVFKGEKFEQNEYNYLKHGISNKNYNHPFGCLFKIENTDFIKFIFELLIENDLVDVFAIEKKSRKSYLEHLMNNENTKYLGVLTPYILDNVLTDDERTYKTCSTFKNEVYYNHGKAILNYISSIQVSITFNFK